MTVWLLAGCAAQSGPGGSTERSSDSPTRDAGPPSDDGSDPADPGPDDDGGDDTPGPTEETCNGFDDDGDGEVDEDCGCEPGETQECFPGFEDEFHEGPICRTGTQTCEGDGEFGTRWGPCEGAELPDAGESCMPDETVDEFVYGETASSRPVDIVWAVDQSGSMGDEIRNVQRNINTFADVISSSGLDYHVIMVAARSDDPDDHELCVPEPLAGPGCSDSDRFRQVDHHVDSHDALLQIQRHIDEIEAFMRDGSLRVFVTVTDDESDLSASVFDSWLRGRGGYDDYVLDAIVGIDESVCDDVAEEGRVYVRLAEMTGGMTEHICTPDWGLAFERFADDIVSRTLVYELSRTPQEDTLTVSFVDPGGAREEQPRGDVWTYDAARNAIVLAEDSTPPDGTTIEARYTPAS